MSVTYKCDGCGKEERANYNHLGDPYKPDCWYERSDKDGPQHACSRACIEKIAKETGKTDLVMPI